MTKTPWAPFFACLSLLLWVGCADQGERGFRSSDPEFMTELKAALEASGIRFVEDPDGFIRYQSEDEAAVRRIRAEVDGAIRGGVAVRFEDEASREYLKQLLKEKDMQYRVETRENGEWIRWYPESEAQREEIEMRVAERDFDAMSETALKDCEDEPAYSDNATVEPAPKTDD